MGRFWDSVEEDGDQEMETCLFFDMKNKPVPQNAYIYIYVCFSYAYIYLSLSLCVYINVMYRSVLVTQNGAVEGGAE